MTPRHLTLSAGLIAMCCATYFLAVPATDTPTDVPPAAAPQAPQHDAWGASPFAAGRPAPTNALPLRNDAAGGPTYGRNGRVVDLEGRNAADYIAHWSSLARNGDAAAAYKVFQVADVCANNDEPLAPYQSEAERDDFLRQRDNLTRLCAGVTPAQVQERMAFLGVAARAGNPQAQIDFFMEGPDGKAATQASDDPAFMQWKTDSLAYLKAAASQGDAFALGLLANAYDAGLVVESDARMSLAYTMANAAARHIDLSPDQLRARFGTQMSDSDFAAALEVGQQISSQCCKK